MTWRSVVIGVLLALAIGATTYFNDSVVRQTPLIGHFLPAAVVGPVVLLALLAIVAGRWGRAFALRPCELLIIAALGLAGCGLPGNGFFRWFATNQAQPAQLVQQRVNWKAAEVMSHVPEGGSVLLLDGRDDDHVVQGLRSGLGDHAGVGDVPWDAWWPVLVRWGGLALLLGLAGLCLAVIVHPQWSTNEQVAYPIVAFFRQLVPAAADGPRFNKLFVGGLLAMVGLHLINGLYAWGLSIIDIPTSYSFAALQPLFPNASRADGAGSLFKLTLIPSVIAFTWFVSTRVSLSVGLANPLWVMFGGLLIANGLSMNTAAGGFAQQSLSLGACLGIAAMVAYVGRNHYAAVLTRMVGVPTRREVPPACVWAGRLLAVLVAVSTIWLSTAGVHWSLALLFVLLALLMFLVITRINVETGMIFVQIGYAPGLILLAWFGFTTIGPTPLLVLLIANVMLLADPRQALMTFLANGLKLAERAEVRPARIAPWLGGVAVAGFLVAGAFTLTTQYRVGTDQRDWIAQFAVPAMPFDTMARQVSDAQAMGTFGQAQAAGGWDWLDGLGHEPGVIVFTTIGLAMVLTCAFAMLRLPWWPLHPVIFVIVGTLPSMWFGWSFLLGWLIKVAALKFGGINAYKGLTPLMVGIIAGEVLAMLGWIVVGWLYYHQTNTLPTTYRILPG